MKKYLVLSFLPGIIYTSGFAQPTITSFTPASGVIGTTVTITGTNFDPIPANNIVYFGAVKAVVNAATATSLQITAPVSSTYEPISVLNAPTKLTAFSKQPFVLTFPGGGNTSSFAPKKDMPTGQSPYRLAMGDLDGDGKPDIVTTDFEEVSIYRNTSAPGNVSFAEKIDIQGMYGSIVLGDFNGDGKKDIAAFTDNFFVAIYENTSTPGIISFAPKVAFPFTGVEMATGDIDGDGRPDLIATNSTSVSILRNTSTNGNISFATKIDFSVNAYGPISVGDLDGDGKPEVAVLNNLVSIMKNTSTSGVISFASPVNLSIGAESNQNTGIVIGDLDGDSKPELAVTNTYYNLESDIYHRVDIFKNTSTNGIISFAPKLEYTTGQYPQSVAINDLDGDGKPDLTVADYVGYGQPGDIAVFTNMSTTGSISFSGQRNYLAGSSPIYNTAGDLDGDGKSDIVIVNSFSNSVSILRNKTIPNSPVISGITDIFPRSAVVHWYSVVGPVTYLVRVYPKGTLNYQYYSPVTDTFTTINNLQPATKYFVDVQAIYSGIDSSYWSFPFTFTTKDSCPTPAGLNAKANRGAALLAWGFPYAATSGFRVSYRIADNTSTWITKSVNATERKTIIRDLFPGTTYMWKMANECGDDSSAWVNGPDFTTLNPGVYSLNKATGAGIQINATGIQVIPNPNNGNFNIKMQLPAKKLSTVLELYDVFGTKVWQQDAGSLSGYITKSIRLNGYTAGNYILVIQRSDIRLVQKIVITK